MCRRQERGLVKEGHLVWSKAGSLRWRGCPSHVTSHQVTSATLRFEAPSHPDDSHPSRRASSWTPFLNAPLALRLNVPVKKLFVFPLALLLLGAFTPPVPRIFTHPWPASPSLYLCSHPALVLSGLSHRCVSRQFGLLPFSVLLSSLSFTCHLNHGCSCLQSLLLQPSPPMPQDGLSQCKDSVLCPSGAPMPSDASVRT